jgi:DNA-binding GntR family transcriptional regulator
MADTNINRDLKNLAYSIIKEKLINCEYAPGSMLNEAQIAEELGFSRTPVRESIGRLEQDGFIRVLPKKGIFVTEVSLNDVTQIFQARIEIEPIALNLAGPHLPIEELFRFREAFSRDEHDIKNGFRVDTAMHLFIIEHCGNRFIIDMMRKLFDENTRVVLATGQNETKIHNAQMEHIQVLNYIIEKDWQKAVNAMRSHIKSCRKAAMDYFSSSAYQQGKYSNYNYKQELQKVNL